MKGVIQWLRVINRDLDISLLSYMILNSLFIRLWINLLGNMWSLFCCQLYLGHLLVDPLEIIVCWVKDLCCRLLSDSSLGFLHFRKRMTLYRTWRCRMANMRGFITDLRIRRRLMLAWSTKPVWGWMSRWENIHPWGQMTRWVTEAGTQHRRHDRRMRKVIPAARIFWRWMPWPHLARLVRWWRTK